MQTLDGADLVLVLFRPAPTTTVNTSLGPGDTARKCALAMSDLSGHGIPTPRLLGVAASAGQAALVMARVNAGPWEPSHRVEAARELAKLHSLPLDVLSGELVDLVRRSDSRPGRVLAGVRAMAALAQAATPPGGTMNLAARRAAELGGTPPVGSRTCLVHGDFFSANLLATEDGVVVIDWETFAIGDPMADLGFLIGADAGLPETETAEVISAYQERVSVDPVSLRWWRNCWATFHLFAAAAIPPPPSASSR